MAIGLSTPLALAACEERLSAVHPAGPAAAAIAELWWVLLVGATAILLGVMAFLLWAFRRRPEGEEPGERWERRWPAGLGLAFPLAVLGALLAYGLVLGERLLPWPHPNLVTVGAGGRSGSGASPMPTRPGA